MDRMRKNVIPESEESASSCDDNSRKLIILPQLHYVKKRDDNNPRVKILVIRADDEQTLYTLDGTKNSTLKDLFEEISQTHKIPFCEGTKFYMERNPALEFDYIVHMGDESRSKHTEDVVDSDDDASIRFAVKRRRRRRILSSPEERRNSPKPTTESRKISNTTKKKDDQPLKKAVDRPELGNGRKARKRRSTESETSTENGEVILPSNNGYVMDNKLDESVVTNTNSVPAATRMQNGTEQIPGMDLGHTNPSSSTSGPALSYNEVIEGGGAILSEIQNVQRSLITGPHTVLCCKMIMIGSYTYAPDESVIISQDGVTFSGPLIRDPRITVPLKIEFQYILQVVVHFEQPLPIIFFYVRSAAGNEIRDSLGMYKFEGPWFQPGCHDATRRLLIIMPRSIDKTSARILKELFAPKKILVESPIDEITSLLLQSAPNSRLRMVKGLIKAIGNRTNGIKDEVDFKKPKKLEIKVDNNSSIVDEQEEVDEFLFSLVPPPMKRPKLDETKNEELRSQWRQEALDIVATLNEPSLPVNDVESEKSKEPVKKNLSLRKKTSLNDTKNRKTKEPVTKNLSPRKKGDENTEKKKPKAIFNEECKITVKKFYQNMSTVENIELRKTEMVLQTPHSPLKRYRTTVSNDEKSEFMLTYPPPPAKGRFEITKTHTDCLRGGCFLNDMIIDFYLKYLTLEVLSEADRSRTFIFSIHFYKRLTSSIPATNTDSDIVLTVEEERHSRVKNWTKNVNIFEKDFVIVPINKNAHWFVVIICFPNLVGKENARQVANDENGVERSSYRRRKAKELAMKSATKTAGRTEVKKYPCILVLDSLPSAENEYKSIISTLRDYLTCEHELRLGYKKIFSEDTIRGALPKVPQQSNFSDCGIYVLQYVESFFTNPIKNFELPIKTLKNWFDEETVSSKRQNIYELLKKLKKSQELSDLIR